jgi:adenylyltransferase/sulfurtransferase
MGGLGCPAALALAPHVDRLGLCDHDAVDLSNLGRQILYRSSDLGRPKVEVARGVLCARGVRAEIIVHPRRLDASSLGMLGDYDVVLDGTDDLPTKFLLNDACLDAGVPLIHAGVVGLTGQLMTVARPTACYRCLFEAPPTSFRVATCGDSGILGPVAGVVGALQAKEAALVLAGAPQLAGRLLVFDARAGSRRTVSFRPRPGCVCRGAARPSLVQKEMSCSTTNAHT